MLEGDVVGFPTPKTEWPIQMAPEYGSKQEKVIAQVLETQRTIAQQQEEQNQLLRGILQELQTANQRNRPDNKVRKFDMDARK